MLSDTARAVAGEKGQPATDSIPASGLGAALDAAFAVYDLAAGGLRHLIGTRHVTLQVSPNCGITSTQISQTLEEGVAAGGTAISMLRRNGGDITALRAENGAVINEVLEKLRAVESCAPLLVGDRDCTGRESAIQFAARSLERFREALEGSSAIQPFTVDTADDRLKEIQRAISPS